MNFHGTNYVRIVHGGFELSYRENFWAREEFPWEVLHFNEVKSIKTEKSSSGFQQKLYKAHSIISKAFEQKLSTIYYKIVLWTVTKLKIF